MEKLTYIQAAKLLGVAQSTIHQAVARGALSRVPITGHVQYVIRDQLLLFTNPKTRFVVSDLSPEKRKLWHEYAKNVGTSVSEDVSTNLVPEVLTQFNTPEVKAALDALNTIGLAERYRKGEISADHFMLALTAR